MSGQLSRSANDMAGSANLLFRGVLDTGHIKDELMPWMVTTREVT